MRNGLVCIGWSLDEPCKWRVIFCSAQRRQEIAHLACPSQPSTDPLLALSWVAILRASRILSVDYVTSWWKPPVAPERSYRGTFKSSLKCNVCYLKSPEEKSFIFIFLFIYFSYLEIGPWLREFRAKNAVDFSQLTFDPGQKELVVGARWEIFRFATADSCGLHCTSVQSHMSCSARVNECWLTFLPRMKYNMSVINMSVILLIEWLLLFTASIYRALPMCQELF